jgi:hypothetical protein
MSATSQGEKAPAAFKFELDRFQNLSRKYLQYWLNDFFDLTLRGPARRRQWITIVFALFAVINILINGPQIFFHLGRIFAGNTGSGSESNNLFNELIYFLALAGVVVIPFLVSAYFALEVTSSYLADIFELKHIDIARTFIRQLSLEGGGHAIRIRAGKIVDEDLESPIIQIGGPGRVIVEFDSAALFEKPDGTPHVIGPVGAPDESEVYARDGYGNSVLDGFERFRAAIDLRDHYIGNPSGEPLTVKGRSLDGLPISAADVRAVYSVRRSEDKSIKRIPTKEQPYPYTRQSIQDLVYQSAVRVLTEGPNPSDTTPSWTSAIDSLIRGTISEYMNENNLSEYLASFGAPEVELAESQERTIQFQRFEITADKASTTTPAVIPQPKFHPRTELSGIFSQLSQRFTRRAHDRGVDLHWIGVGTWKIPEKIASDIVSGQHVQAWQINRENAQRGSKEALEEVFIDSFVARKAKLIQDVPLTIYKENEKAKKGNIGKEILMAYWELLGEAADVYYNAGDPLPKELKQALKKIEGVLFSNQHYIGGNPPSKIRLLSSAGEEKTPPAPLSQKEARLYPQLLRLLNGEYKKAEWLIAYENQKFPDYNREQLIQYLIDHPELCNL